MLEKNIPIRVVRFKPKEKQIADTAVAKIVKQRDRFLKKYKKFSDVDFLLKAQKLGKRIRKIVRIKEKYKIQMKLQSTNPKSFWTTIASMMGIKDEEKIKIKVGDNLLENEKDIADQFANFFLKKVLNLQGQSNILDETLPMPFNGEYESFTIDEIQKAAKSLRSKKCYGKDGIPLKIIKDIAVKRPELLEPHLNEIGRNGLTNELKISRIIPLHKKGDKTAIENYRPIANLSSISKIYEKILLTRLLRETEGKEGCFQHGYRKHHSTTTALLELQARIARRVEGRSKVAVYSMDLSAAFDLLRPGIMIKSLEKMNVSAQLQGQIQDFLINRKLFVDLNGNRSSELSR